MSTIIKYRKKCRYLLHTVPNTKLFGTFSTLGPWFLWISVVRFSLVQIFKKLPKNPSYAVFTTLQMFTGVYKVLAEKSECGDFKFMGIACTHAIPVILKSPHSDFHCNICREFGLQGYYGDTPH